MTKSDRLAQFFQSDGKTVIVPIDHGTAIPVPGLEQPAALIEALNPHADGYVVNYGVARACAAQLAGKGVCFRTDVYKPAHHDNPDSGSYLVYGAADALACGAGAVMNMLYLHHPNEPEIFREAADLIADCRRSGLPVILETLPYGIGRPDDYTLENIGFAVRAAAELGADVVKTAFPTGASADDFRRIVDACFVPVIVLGGAATGDDAALLGMVKNAVDAGAAGIAVGRNVWQHPNPPAIAAALKAVVHEGASAESAAQIAAGDGLPPKAWRG